MKNIRMAPRLAATAAATAIPMLLAARCSSSEAAAITEGGNLRLNTESYLTYFAADLPRNEAAVLASSQGPIFAHVLQDKVPTISSGHTELLSHPQEVAAVILDAVDHLR